MRKRINIEVNEGKKEGCDGQENEERKKVESFSGKRDQVKGTNRLNEGKNGDLGIEREKESNRENKKKMGNERR